MRVTHKKLVLYCATAVMAFGLVGCSGTTADTQNTTDESGVVSSVSFENVTNGSDEDTPDAISMTEDRSFKATALIEGMSVEELQAAIDAEDVEWTLSREVGEQNYESFPYQYLGGDLSNWKTVADDQQESGPFFKDITMSAVDIDGATNLELTFDNNSFYGTRGIDQESRRTVRNSFLDYAGMYDLSCTINGNDMASMEVEFLPYDSYSTQDDINAELPQLVAQANENGIYAEIQQIGISAGGRPINAVFVAKQESDLSDYLALTEREETEPQTVQEELEAGNLDYKLPVVYSNVHSDEIVASDGVMEFLRSLCANEPVSYKDIDSLTDTGKAKLDEEMTQDATVWSDLIKDKATGVGYIQGDGVNDSFDDNPDGSVDMTEGEFEGYYNITDETFDPSEVLDHEFFIIVPTENPDGRTQDTRTNLNGFDMNRDNTYQTQPETIAMTSMIAKWNPITLHELHGYYSQYQCEPCSPTHDPNNEYDLFIDKALNGGEAFISASISNNDAIDSCQMPMRDYLKLHEDGTRGWDYPFDDMSTSYTPQYAMMHGTNAYTVELPFANEDAVEAIKYGFIGNADYVAENADDLFMNQLERFRRGVENIDSDEIDKFYVSQADEPGAEADIFRPRNAENDNFFPEYYVIPLDRASQENRSQASEIATYLLRNDVKVSQTTEDVDVDGTTYKAGTLVVDMHQAKRNMANCALYPNLVISDWTDLYSEPLTNFSEMRGFSMDTIRSVGAFDGVLEAIEMAPVEKTIISGEGAATIISNNGIEAVSAVNELLRDGKTVGLITDGDTAGDYVVSSADFETVEGVYVLDATQTDEIPGAKTIKNGLTVYVPGVQPEFATDVNGQQYGFRNYTNILNNAYNWDKFALAKQMGFTLAESFDTADIMVGNQTLSEKESAAVAAGKPYVGYSYNAAVSAKAMGIGFDYNEDYLNNASSLYDAFDTVIYPTESLTTATYVEDGDNNMYGYGGIYYTDMPEGADVLIQTTDDQPIEGFMSVDHINEYKNSVQALEYVQNGYDITLFANTLTNKCHQQDDYRYLSSTIFAKNLGEDFQLMS